MARGARVSAGRRPVRREQHRRGGDAPFAVQRGPYDLAPAVAAETGERWSEAEMLRFRAAALVARGDATAAPRCLDNAIALARTQEARLWELRSAIALAPLLTLQGHAAEGHRVLASAHGRLADGVDAPDLAAARTLLTRLRP